MDKDFLMNVFFLFAGWILGFLQPAIISFFKRLRKKSLNKKSLEKVITYDPQDDNIIMIHSWSLSHRLLPHYTIIKYVDSPRNYYYIKDIEEFESIRQGFSKQNYCGNVCYMVGYKIDHGDNHYGDVFEMTVAPCDYSESLSVSPYLEHHPDVITQVVNQININPYKYFENAIPSDIFINVMVVSECDNFLVLRRSKAVASAQGKWCVGSFETMEFSLQETAKSDKNFHLLTQRCLEEELDLYQQETLENGEVVDCYNFNSIFISSISLSLYHMGTLITAVVKVKGVTEGYITNKILKNAHSKYEHDGIEWLPFNKKNIKEYIEKDIGYFRNFVNDKKGEWIGYSKWSLYELARVYDFDKLLQ